MKKLKLNRETISILGNRNQKNLIGGDAPSDDPKSICISGSCGTSCCPTLQMGPAGETCQYGSCVIKCYRI